MKDSQYYYAFGMYGCYTLCSITVHMRPWPLPSMACIRAGALPTPLRGYRPISGKGSLGDTCLARPTASLSVITNVPYSYRIKTDLLGGCGVSGWLRFAEHPAPRRLG